MALPLLTSLLNSLHSHLQAQTQLLPTLHVQLGLPPTALEEELLAIQENLMKSVESQIESRRKEVEMWTEKCEAVEENCSCYTKALGGNIKSTGSSIGELRKEKALPRRYEMLSEHQEKLRQVRGSTMTYDCPEFILTIAVSYQTRTINDTHQPHQCFGSHAGTRFLRVRYHRSYWFFRIG